MSNIDYKAAYERQKQARAMAEELLESRSRELYEANQSLQYAYNKLKNQKAQIIHQEKLASIGQLAAGVAHEINNPAAYVKSNLNTLKRYSNELGAFFKALDHTSLQNQTAFDGTCSGENDTWMFRFKALYQKYDIPFLLQDIVEIVDDSDEGIERIEIIVKGLKEFSRPDSAENESVDLIACIENTLKLVTNQVKHSLDVSFDWQEKLFIQGQHGSLSQVFLNLIVNASHAVTKDGRLQITAKSENGYAYVSFCDNGCGIDQKNQAKIFEPFFSTKEQGAGTGLGLSISHGIIKKHGGTISVKSELGEGAEFIIQIPLEH